MLLDFVRASPLYFLFVLDFNRVHVFGAVLHRKLRSGSFKIIPPIFVLFVEVIKHILRGDCHSIISGIHHSLPLTLIAVSSLAKFPSQSV